MTRAAALTSVPLWWATLSPRSLHTARIPSAWDLAESEGKPAVQFQSKPPTQHTSCDFIASMNPSASEQCALGSKYAHSKRAPSPWDKCPPPMTAINSAYSLIVLRLMFFTGNRDGETAAAKNVKSSDALAANERLTAHDTRSHGNDSKQQAPTASLNPDQHCWLGHGAYPSLARAEPAGLRCCSSRARIAAAV